jgi:hypothetical protein
LGLIAELSFEAGDAGEFDCGSLRRMEVDLDDLDRVGLAAASAMWVDSGSYTLD